MVDLSYEFVALYLRTIELAIQAPLYDECTRRSSAVCGEAVMLIPIIAETLYGSSTRFCHGPQAVVILLQTLRLCVLLYESLLERSWAHGEVGTQRLSNPSA